VVRTDDVAGARLATEHLVGLGHRRVVHVDGGDAPGAAERRRGYKQAMEVAGLDPRIVDGGLDEAAGERAVMRLPSGRQRPTAVVAFNDHCAAGMLGTLRAAGSRVPDDLSLVGYDDSRVAALASVDLATVRQDAALIAQEALGLATTRIDEPASPSREVVVPPTLVPRSTTAPLT
jgi:DNA-binding LacI/PurR family transcriptional regulator